MIFQPRVSQLDRLIFTKHLAVMVKAGIPLAEGIQIAGDHTRRSSLQSISRKIHESVSNGQNLADALAAFPSVFGEVYRSLVKVGEETGTLQETLEYLTDQMSKEIQLRKKMQGALLYPSLVLFAAFVVGSMVALFVLPQLITLFSAFQTDLPLSTRILLWIAEISRDYGLVILLAIISAVAAFLIAIRLPLIKPIWDRILLKIPVIGPFLRTVYFAQLSRNFGVLLKSGVPLVVSLEILIDATRNAKLRDDLMAVKTVTESGTNMSQAMEQLDNGVFPAIMIRMIAIGERTGNLDESLLYLAEFYEEDIDNISKTLTTIIEPLLLLGVGLIVGFIALAIISPIYELSGSIRR